MKERAANEILRSPRPAPVWSPPEQGWLKLNVDASFIEAIGQASKHGCSGKESPRSRCGLGMACTL